MRQIKFHGRDIETGRTVYGGYKVGRCGEPIIITNFTAAYEVKPESVAQLIEIDAHGREVYEGDTIIDQHGIEYTAYLVGIADGETEFIRLDDEIETATVEFKLKEE